VGLIHHGAFVEAAISRCRGVHRSFLWKRARLSADGVHGRRGLTEARGVNFMAFPLAETLPRMTLANFGVRNRLA